MPDVRHITIAPGQLLNEKSCIMISQETLEYSPSEVFDCDHSEIRRRYFHRKGAYRKIFLNLDYEGPDKEKEQFMHDLKEPDYRKIQNPVLRRVMQEIKGDEEAMEIMCVRVLGIISKLPKSAMKYSQFGSSFVTKLIFRVILCRHLCRTLSVSV